MELINGLTEDIQKQKRNQIIAICSITTSLIFNLEILEFTSYFNILKFILFNN